MNPTDQSAKDQLTSQTLLIRTLEANLKVAIPDAEELRFRGSACRKAAADLGELKPAFVVRLYEAACEVKFPSDDVAGLRKAIQKSLGKTLGLAAFRQSPAAS